MKAEDIKVGMKVRLSQEGINFCNEHVRDILLANKGVVEVASLHGYECKFFVFRIRGVAIVMDCSYAEPYNESYVCTIPGVTIEFVPGKTYWVSDSSEENATEMKAERTYVCTIGTCHYFVGSDHIGNNDYPNNKFSITRWRYAVDPETYKEPETELTVEQIADILRSKGLIKGALKIKEA